jgi:hypothetical protein
VDLCKAASVSDDSEHLAILMVNSGVIHLWINVTVHWNEECKMGKAKATQFYDENKDAIIHLILTVKVALRW